MSRRNQKYSKNDFERDLDELARLIEEQNGGEENNNQRNNRRSNDDDEENQNGGRRQRNNRRSNDDDEDDQNGGGKHEKTHRTFTVIEVDGKEVKARGVYRIKSSDTPLKAAERAYAQLFRKSKGKTSHELKIRETSRYEGDKKVYGPYVGKSKKLDKPKIVKRGSTTIKIEWEHHVELK